MRFRGKTIRRKIVALLLVPLVTLTAIWAFATYLTGREAGQLTHAAMLVAKFAEPAGETVQAVQQERRQVLVHLADPRRSDALSQLTRQQEETDAAVTALRRQTDAVRADLPENSRGRLETLHTELDALGGIREQVQRNTATRESAFTAYTSVIDPLHDVLVTLHSLRDATLDREGKALVGLSRARELLSREDALMASALAAGRMTREELREFSDRIAERRITYSTNLAVLPGEERRHFDDYWDGASGQLLTETENTALAAGPDGVIEALDAERWEAAASAVLKDLERLNGAAADRLADRVAPAARSVLLLAGLAGVGGFFAVALSVVVSFRIGRGLIKDLGTLRREAHEVSGVRLPSVMRRLAAGEQVDVETEAPRLEYGPDELGQAAQALNTLQRAAVEAAVKQADMRRGVSEVFVNLARRSQVLLHRQLALLDTMERRTEDADELADLFRLDHLTTRMRRHAEGLVILSGAAPSRQWRKPVGLTDVVRAAVAEVEDYERIEIRRLAPLAVDGPAVGDLTHLIAELLENATSFSPPHTAVQVRGDRVAGGFALEIHDRGLGMPPEALLEANLRLAETPEFELSDTDRLGLFVVSRLAQRQGVRVSLQPSPYGGTTAVVLIPASALNEADPASAPALEHGRGDAGVHHRTLTRVPATPQRDPATALSVADTGAPRGHGRPVELDGPLEGIADPLDELDHRRPDDTPPDGIGSLFRALREQGATTAPAPAAEQHHGRDERSARETDGPTASGEPAPLPRRPGTGSRPVLVADHGRPVGRPPEPARDATPGGQTPRAGTKPEPPTTPGGLPRRRRQASLAPQPHQGRHSPDAPAGEDGTRPAEGTGRRAGTPADRDAEQVRDRMAALQRGWARGRQHNDGTTPGGDGR
ncbi:nitrate- and nitrite sensing domain-containing protein [Streptomyces sp. JJ66]|uniref:nitrate- and nitrite sensing domain-containing protein n=1 Tax=Streptomyces sp. JJ66 TaxID=2803843 RepID=UPI001C56E701|nr:nitrate- and nitrite sensing domain-containing protein [Streptomyces sp. JJ66]MBW1602125.1 nitrate- and nitrite sensing domain-containing protein [Streptomyces sp. JJ66]